MAADDASDRIINRNWRVVRKLGQGGMGTVWEVRHKESRHMRCAVKEIKPSLSQDSEVVRRFLREFRLMAEFGGVDHIVRVTDFDREAGFVFMNLVDGPSLAQIIDDHGGLEYALVLRFGRQIATALDAVHSRRIVHRDIKPPNVLIDQHSEKAYLTDFGIAKKLELGIGDETIDGTLTGEGPTVDLQYMGTPRYSAPEQLRVEYPPDPLWDVYSLGVTLYEAYSGHRYLPQFRRYHEFLRSVGTDPHFEIALPYRSPAPPSFAALIEECIRRDPAQRLQTAAKLAAGLAECEEEYRRHTVGIGPAPAKTQPPALEDQETRKDDLGEPRRHLREEIERQFGALEQLEGTIVAMGLNLPVGPASETLGHALRDISVFENDGKYREALGHLETLRERVAIARTGAEQAARDGAAQRIAVLEDDCHALERDGGRWLDAVQLSEVRHGLGKARQALAEGRWNSLGDDLAGVSEQLRAIAERARVAAQRDAAGILSDVAERLAAVRALDAAAASDGVELPLLLSEVDAHIGSGHLVAGIAHAEAARVRVDHALNAALVRAQAQVAAARGRLIEELSSLDLIAARTAIPDDVARLERARAAAAAAEEGGDLPAAATAYAEAAAAAADVAEQLAEVQRAERSAAVDELRAILAELAAAPAELADQARRAATRLLDDLPPKHDDAVSALRAAAVSLVAVRDELPGFTDAVGQREAAAAGRAAARDADIPRHERRGAEQTSATADRLFAERRWDEAAAQYRSTATRWKTATVAAEARSLAERCSALRTSVRESLEQLVPLDAERAALSVSIDAELTVDGLNSALAALDAQQRAGDLTGAAAGLAALSQRIARAHDAHETALGSALTAARIAVAAQRDLLVARADELLREDALSACERHIAKADAAMRARRWGAARAAFDAARSALDALESTLRRDSTATVAAQLAAAAADVGALAELGAEAPVDLEATRAHAHRQLDDGAYGAASKSAMRAAAQAAAALATQQRTMASRAQAAREGFAQRRGALDIDAAPPAAQAEVRRAERLFDEGVSAERAGSWVQATSAFEAASAAMEGAVAQVNEAVRRALSEQTAALRDALRNAAAMPDELAESARQFARAALNADAAAEPRARLGALREALAALSGVRHALPQFAEAADLRDRLAASDDLAALPLSAEERAEFATPMEEGAAAMVRGAWAEARQRFVVAEERATVLRAVGEDRIARHRALEAERAAARDALGALLAASSDAPDVVVADARRAAEQAVARTESEPGALRDAAAALADAQAEVPAYQRAEAARRTAEQAYAQLRRRRLKRARFNPARTALRTAGMALEARQWQAAGDAYETAQAALAVVAELPDDRSPRRTTITFLILLLVLAAGGAGVRLWREPEPMQVSRESKPTVPSPAAPAKSESGSRHLEASPVAAPPALPPVHIAMAEPAGEAVALRDGGTQTFSIALAPDGASAEVRWAVDGSERASGPDTTSFEYRAEPGTAPRSQTVVVAVAGGNGAEQTHRWTVNVAANQRPQVAKALPPVGQELREGLGRTARFAVEASDPERDPLRYRWTVDGQPAGDDAPALELPVTRESQTVAVSIGDGKPGDPIDLRWKLRGVLQGQPATLAKLAFGSAQTFRVDSPISGKVIWAVDGDVRQAATGPTFSFNANSADSVGRPITVRAAVVDAAGKPVARDWTFTVTPPPAPRVLAASPAPGIVEVARDVEQRLALTAPPPVDGQTFAYLFEVDGREIRSSTPSVTVGGGPGERAVVAMIEDNFKQRSKATRWTIRLEQELKPTGIPDPGIKPVDSWLEAYRVAINRRDVEEQCTLLKLSAENCEKLRISVAKQRDLITRFDSVLIEALAGGGATARYMRVDRFVDPSGKQRTQSTSVTQRFRIDRGVAQIVKP